MGKLKQNKSLVLSSWVKVCAGIYEGFNEIKQLSVYADIEYYWAGLLCSKLEDKKILTSKMSGRKKYYFIHDKDVVKACYELKKIYEK